MFLQFLCSYFLSLLIPFFQIKLQVKQFPCPKFSFIFSVLFLFFETSLRCQTSSFPSSDLYLKEKPHLVRSPLLLWPTANPQNPAHWGSMLPTQLHPQTLPNHLFLMGTHFICPYIYLNLSYIRLFLFYNLKFWFHYIFLRPFQDPSKSFKCLSTKIQILVSFLT